ncbi:MAG TPA: FtsX-like permease family protein [Spirochaetia bacterium]|nr:FtsX-like permease family protein [Spirochaetia bacterium]
MKLGSVFFYSVRHFWSGEDGKRVSQLRGAVIGIALSLVPLVVVLEVANGMIEGITARYVEIGTFHLQVKSFNSLSAEELDSAAREVRSVKGVVGAFPIYSGLGLAYSSAGRTGVAVRALPSDLYSLDTGFRKYMTVTSGSFDLGGLNSVLLSDPVAAKLHAKVGDEIRLLTAKSLPGGGFILRPTLLVVRGTFTTGYNELDSLSIYVSQAMGSRLFTDPGSAFIGVTVNDPYGNLSAVSWNIKQRMSGEWYVYTWYDIEKPMYKTFETTKNLLLFIMVLIVIVASVNISSSLVMLVIEKRSEIAILKGLGGSPRGISRSFVFAGFIIGVSGTALGLLLGLLAAVNINQVISGIQLAINGAIDLWRLLLSPFTHAEMPSHITLLSSSYYLSTIPIRIDWPEIAIVGMVTVTLATAAAWFPARQASQIKPLEILRRY